MFKKIESDQTAFRCLDCGRVTLRSREKAHECPECEGLESEIAEGCSAVGAGEARLPRAGLLLPLGRRGFRLHLAALHERHRAMQPW
jgi:hypothetical protein